MSLVEDALKKLRRATDIAPAARAVQPAVSKPRPVASTSLAPAARRQFGDMSQVLDINLEALRGEHLIAPEEDERQIAQQFRAIKRPLIAAALEGARDSNGVSARLIMVASALQGDGKTFTSINLALSLARERDFSVLLVDGDAAKPHVTRVFNRAGRPGLLDLLQDASRNAETVIVPTSVPGLSFLPSGQRVEGISELFGSARMAQVLSELQSLDPRLLIVVDSPPILLTSEARVMAPLFGQMLLVVRAGITPQHAVSEALEAVGDTAAVKLVLNEAVHAGGGSYYGYGYQYGDTQS